jgi:hypothetical protein
MHTEDSQQCACILLHATVVGAISQYIGKGRQQVARVSIGNPLATPFNHRSLHWRYNE